MNYPQIHFKNANGESLDRDDDGIPYIKEYGDYWYVSLDEEWEGGVTLLATPSIPLIRVADKNYWELPEHQRKKVKRRSGDLTFVLTDAFGETIEDYSPVILRIYSANISEEQMEQMIADIGILALSTACCVHRSIPVPLGEGSGAESQGQQWFAGYGILTTATALLQLASTVQNNWEEIERKPLKSAIAEVGPVEINKSNLSPQTLIRAKLEPGKRRVLGVSRQESTQCLENEFLCYILDVYLIELARGLASSLESLELDDCEDSIVPSLNKKNNRDSRIRSDRAFQEFIEISKQRIETARKQKLRIQGEINRKVSQLRSCAIWAKQARSSEFLQNVVTPKDFDRESLRLIESPSYGPIFSQYMESRGGVFKALQKVLHLFEHIYRGEVRYTWEIYEIWCVVKLYSGFILYANMKPLETDPSLFEAIEVNEKGTLTLVKNKPFVLRIKGDKLLKIGITYEPELKTETDGLRTPDIVLFTSLNHPKNREDNYQSLHVFDAKYRNYKQQGGHRLIEDVWTIAKERYLDEFKSCNSSFILHTDQKTDYWGEVPFNQFITERFEEQPHELKEEADDYAEHTYGAISLLPRQDKDRQIKRILRLILQYHNRELSTTCLSCGQKLKEEVDIRASWKPNKMSEGKLIDRVVNWKEGNNVVGTGIYCSCPKCGEFWVVHQCYGSHHLLLKFKDSFHRHSKHPEFKNRWMYICPVCGSDPSLEDIYK